MTPSLNMEVVDLDVEESITELDEPDVDPADQAMVDLILREYQPRTEQQVRQDMLANMLLPAKIIESVVPPPDCYSDFKV